MPHPLTELDVIVKACINGARPPGDHPALPVRPEEFAREARAAVGAGASLLHVHPRRGDGAESMDAQTEAAVLAAVRRVCPGVPVGVTTGAWVEPDPARRLALVRSWTVLPDFASVNLSEEGAVELCEELLGSGIGIEPGLARVEDARLLLESGLAPRAARLLVEVDGLERRSSTRGARRRRSLSPQAVEARHRYLTAAPGNDEQVELAAAIDAVLDEGGVPSSVRRFHHGSEGSTWAVLARALDVGHHVRIGLEDTLVLPDGSTARDNGDLVAAAVALARDHGRVPASR